MSHLGQTPDIHERLLAACPIAVVAAEVDRVVHANPAALGLLGIEDAARVPPLGLVHLFHPDDRAAVETWLASGEEVRPALEARVVRPDGSVRYVEATSAAVPVTTGQAVLVTMQDVTERRRASERARSRELSEQQQQRLADIAAVTTKVVHDVANPVAGLIMNTQRVLQVLDRLPPAVGASLRPSIARVLDPGRKLAALLQEFRDFVCAQRLDLQPVALGHFLESARAEWTHEAAAHGATVSVECPRELGVRADPLRLRRALDNLVRNALDAIDRGPGEVHVGAAATLDGKVRIVVRDTGPGIAAGLDPFALFATTKSDGTGLGLPSARQIVEAHGGTVQLVADGRRTGGASFAIELPATRH
jgi:PAS domain S-box-containing protein